MRRLTSLVILSLFVATPAFAQDQQPPRSTGGLTPLGLPATVAAPAPTPAPDQAPPRTTGQTPPVTVSPAPAPRASAPRAPQILSATNKPMPSSTNIKLDLLITDTYTGTPVEKTVSLIILSGNSGMIRTNGSDGFSVLNIDAIAAAYTGGLVSIRMTFEYTPNYASNSRSDEPPNRERAPRLNESITVALQDGQPMVISQSADPATDRKVTAALTATILK